MIEKLLLLSVVFLASMNSSYGVGQVPVPQITDVSFTAELNYDSVSGPLTYRYGIASGASHDHGYRKNDPAWLDHRPVFNQQYSNTTQSS